MRRRTFSTVAMMLALSACGGMPQGGYQPGVMTRLAPGAKPLTAAPPGSRVVLLAPLTGANAERGAALAAAAKLALAEPGSPQLDVLDTASTPAGAAEAAKQAVALGAGIIIGPLTGPETAAAAGPATAARIPMLPFTNDAAQGRPGVWPLGLTPGQQVRRLVGSLTAQGRSRFAAVLPQNEFGQAMAAALTQAVADASLPPPDIRFHGGSMGSASEAIRDISAFASRRGPIDAQMRAARNEHTAEGRRRAAELQRAAIPGPPMDVLLLGDFGERLGMVASLLPYYDVDQPTVRIIGPAQWSAPAALDGATLTGALYAAPDPALRGDFNTRFTAATGGPAPGLADLAYDAASIARVLATSGEGYSLASLTRPEGFAGVNGALALMPDGRVRRGLAVFALERGGANLVEPAPDRLTGPGI